MHAGPAALTAVGDAPCTTVEAWKALRVDAGVRAARLHDAGHPAATLLLQQGVAPRVAMQLLGHSQISMTMHYTHAVPELATDEAVRMDAALGWPPASPREDGTRTAQEPSD